MRVVRFRVVVALVVTLPALLAGCTSSTDPEPPSRSSGPETDGPTPTGPGSWSRSASAPGWESLDVDGTASALGGDSVVVAAGTDDGGPWVRYLAPGGARPPVRNLLSGIETPDAVTEYADFVAVVDLEGGQDARAAGSLVLDGLDEQSEIETPVDDEGRAPTWLRIEFDGEEALHAAGLVPGDSDRDAWRLTAWSDTGRWTTTAATPTVYAAPGEVPVADATQSGVVVAGHLAATPPAPGTTPPVALWTGPDAYATTPRWTRRPLRPAPDAVSDVRCWDLGCWVAGVRGGRAVLHDHDQLGGAVVPTPAVGLAPDGAVLIARTAVPFGLVVVAETDGGNEVWFRDRPDTRRASTWRRLAAPPGELQSARAARGHVYLLVDGTLWHGRLADLRPAG